MKNNLNGKIKRKLMNDKTQVNGNRLLKENIVAKASKASADKKTESNAKIK
jgi:hypothetical protein